MRLKKIITIFLITLILLSVPLMTSVQANSEDDIMLLSADTVYLYDYYSGNSASACYSKTFKNLNGVQLLMQFWIEGSSNVRVDVYRVDSLGVKLGTIYSGVAYAGGQCNTINILASSNSELAAASRVKITLTILSTPSTTVFVEGNITY